ncbi:LuxR C-terminal-related transcriptional regulator [Mycobacterium cookii]|uniref:LuxR family transcriptional regulator n=1 Tax=Mycobacterium cookii TaxID=1775 RepID=A0A7I7L3W4_9MYCO|nr:LuxR family transcriptional regulator [Mycobacterium cookii]MCV7329441.1 helix-turn-helix transcriptional regulator [Mycobacterium cookii]BBX48727.1 LuxR family transcriptional regulator [Mycobacterium cookii]
MRMRWPLIGRSEEMRVIEAAISASDVPGIVVYGAAGVGKSRIVREALSSVESRGYEGRLAVGASSARAIPLGVFSAWAQSGVTDTVQLLRGVIESLTSAAAGTTVVLGVDDVHLLDELSLFVVHQIVQRGAAKVVLTVLDGEPIPEAVQEIWRGGRFDRLDLQPLSLDETTTLLTTAFEGPVDPDVPQRLWKLARGNVLYLRNIVEQEVADGRLVQQHGYWRWIGDPVIPRSLVELIESRTGALVGPVSDVVDALAVGEPIELAALSRITDPAAVEEAETRGLITLEPAMNGVEVRVAHPLYGEVRRRRAPATKLRRLRGLVAAELAASVDHEDIQVVVRRATLSLDSDLTPNADLLVNAAQGAVWLADLALADRLADAAARAGGGPEPNFVRAHALSWLGRGEEADAVLAAIRTSELTDGERARLAFLRASNALWALGDPARAKGIIDEALETTPPTVRTYIDAFLTVYWFAMDRPEAARQASESLALEHLPAVVGAEIAWVLAVIAADAGRTAEAVAVAEAGYTAATRSFDAPHMRFNIADAHISALLLSGRTSDALEVADRVRRQAAELPGAAQLLGSAVAGRAALGAGRLDTACVMLEQAAEGLSASHAIGWGYRYRIPRTAALAMRGLTDEAATRAVLADRRLFRSLDYESSLARAWVLAGQGAVSEAITVVLSAAERAAANGQFAAEVVCLQTATQFGDRTGALRLRALESIVEGSRVGLAARFAAALRDGDAAELSSVSEEFERMGDLVAALDAAAYAALAYRSQNLRGSALSCSARADALAEQCGGASTPAFRRATGPLPLTDREAEIVMMIGQGLSNRAIAERLTVSVRTVESHIYRAMSKTETTGRDELAALIPSHKARLE